MAGKNAKLLTVAGIKNRKPDPAGKRIEDYDKAAPGLVLRTAPTGAKSFAWRGRVKGQWQIGKGGMKRPADPICITISPVPAIDEAVAAALKDARAKARAFGDTARDGTDPRDAWKAKPAEEVQTFEALAELFIAGPVAKLRSAGPVAANIRNYLVKAWGKLPAASITEDHIITQINQILEDGKPTAARIILANLKTLFGWACSKGRGQARLKTNPAALLSAKRDFDIKPNPRQHILSNDDLALVWRAAETLSYPRGPFFKMLILSGQRRSEAAGMKWAELDLDRDMVWNIPADRMKKAKAHEVPLSPAMVELLTGLRKSRAEDAVYVFSPDLGKSPLRSFDDAKRTIDEKIKELAPDAEMAPWTIHDLRRTMRTGLGAIPAIAENVAELTVAHIPPALVRNYNVHQYRDEKRQALTLWADRLAQIISPPPVGGNVVAFSQAAQ